MSKAKITPEEATRLRSSAAVKAAVKAFRRKCEAEDAPCWLCEGPIDYQAEKNFPYAFEADHAYPLAQFPDWAADPAVLRPSHHECNRRRGGKLGTGTEGADLGTTSQDWEGMTDLPARRRPGAARRRPWWYEENGIDEDDREALLERSRRLIAAEGEDEQPRFGRGARRPAARSAYYDDNDDDLGEFFAV